MNHKSGKISKGEAQTALQDQGSAMTPQQAQQLAAAAKVQTKLKKTICKFVSEWSKADIDKQWGGLKDKAQADPSIYLSDKEDKANHLSDDWTPFRKHVEALAIDFSKITGLPAKHWHFHPREFIKQFRKCGWLSEREMLQLIPQNVIRKPGSHNSNHSGVFDPVPLITCTPGGVNIIYSHGYIYASEHNMLASNIILVIVYTLMTVVMKPI